MLAFFRCSLAFASVLQTARTGVPAAGGACSGRSTNITIGQGCGRYQRQPSNR